MKATKKANMTAIIGTNDAVKVNIINRVREPINKLDSILSITKSSSDPYKQFTNAKI